MAASRARLAAGFFWYFAAVGVFVPYWPVYLDARGLDALAIGFLMSVFAAMRVVGAPLYAHWADASGRPLSLLRFGAAACLACALAFPWLGPLPALALALALYSALWNGIVSVYDAHVLDRLGAESGRYGALRLWGSVGFIATSIAGGVALAGERVGLLPYLLAALIGCTWLSFGGQGGGAAPAPRREAPPLGPLLRDRRVIVFLLVSFLMLASHGAYYGFLSLYLAEHGHSSFAIGALWAWAVAAEILVFLCGRWLLERFSLHALVVAAVAATALRWLLIATFPGNLALVALAQAGHMASFGLFHLCSVNVARRLFPAGAAARAQALHGSVGFGLGGMVGAVAAGWIWEAVSPQAAFYASAAVAALATLLAAAGLGGLPPERDGYPDFGKSRV